MGGGARKGSARGVTRASGPLPGTNLGGWVPFLSGKMWRLGGGHIALRLGAWPQMNNPQSPPHFTKEGMQNVAALPGHTEAHPYSAYD